MAGTPDYSGRFDRALEQLVRDAWRVTLEHPGQALFFLRAVRCQRRAARVRQRWEARGVHVPPVMIVSITRRCNLHCRGCYHRALRASEGAELAPDRFQSLLAQAHELGFSAVFLAGGEPLLRPELLDIAAGFPDIIFPVFTNGLLIDDAFLGKLERSRHLVPVLSIEGNREDTDARRGPGVFAHLAGLGARLARRGLFYGASLTVTGQNLDVVTDATYVRRMIEAGCRLFFFVEYVPVEDETDSWTLTPDRKQDFIARLDAFRRDLPGLFVGFPGDEEEYGGCLSAGRGFIHVATDGRVEPCPFAPYSDATFGPMSLKEALGSEFLRAIRENHGRLKETRGGCALWAERDWVRSLLARTAGAKTTG